MMETEYRVLTLWQPWATLLAYGVKMNETRPKDTSFRGVYLIHAAKRWNTEQRKISQAEPFYSVLRELNFNVLFRRGTWGGRWENYSGGLPVGEIIGAFEVDECLRSQDIVGKLSCKEIAFGDYSDNRSVWIGKNHRLLKTPIPYKNGQGYYQKFKGDINDLIFM